LKIFPKLFRYAAIGCLEGSVRILDLNTLKHIKIIKNRKEWISDIKFSPDNSKVAVGSHDNFVDVYSVPEF
jgi:WD40 repeat protein